MRKIELKPDCVRERLVYPPIHSLTKPIAANTGLQTHSIALTVISFALITHVYLHAAY